jgi:mRNA interferase HicA
VKRTDLLKTLVDAVCVLVRHGRKHDWFRNPATGVSQPVPRHGEIKEQLARHIIRMLENAEQLDP